MELSCSEVPLYGQMTVYANFDKNVYLPEDAEFYFIYDGSHQRHIVIAERIKNNVLQSSIPVSLHRESLLHLAMRWGLAKLSQFLLCLPGGVQALALPNEEGATPLDLALHGGHSKLVEDITNFQGRRSPGFSRVQLCEEASLHYVHSPETLTLTLNHTAEHLLEADIKLFRKYFWDRAFLLKALEQEAKSEERTTMPSGAAETEEEIQNLVSSRSSSEKEDAKCVKSLVVQLNEHEDQDSLDLDRSFDVLKKSKHPPTLLAAGRLSDMLNGGDEVYANCMVIDQVGDLDINYINIEGITADTSPEPMGSTLGPQSCKNVLSTETNPTVSPLSENNKRTAKVEAQQSFMSPSSSCTSNLNLSCGLRGFEKEQSHLKKRSSSLDALDADSEGEGHSEQSHICYTPVSQSSSRTGIPSGDELDSFETSVEPDFNISRAESLSLSSNLQSKESLLFGVRSRSYSCSSPKISLGKTQLVRDFTVCNSSEEQRAYSLPEPPREKRIQEEEWDKDITPAKSESEKYKVSRTFSFLMNRMTSPRNKSKTKSKDAKDKEKLNRHQFVPGTFSGVLQCSVCDKTLLGKESFQCSNCNTNVHKGCKDAVPPCTKKFQEKYNKNKPQTILGNSSFRDVPQPGLSLHPSSSMPIGLPAGRKETAGQVHPLSRSVPGTTLESYRRSATSLESESDSNNCRSRSHSDELLQSVGSSPSTESFIMEDVVDSSLWSDLSSDAREFEAESWSLVVDPSFCSRQEKDVIKRQDVIFELMQTEMHHIQTLFIMSEIFRKGMKEELQLDHSTVDKIFPCLDELLEIHRHFFYSMKERRQESCADNDRNFVINQIGDILVQQFSEENASKMKKIYGEFCSHHKEAVNLFKELQQNKKFQNFIKLRNSNLLARRRGIPECILLVTQRITKYPVLVERILQYTKERTEEHKDLCKALCLIKDMIATVDLKVNEYEKNQKWLEIVNKIENKTYTKLKNGHVFRKQALISKERTLLYDGLVYWKTATGRFKDILALLLTDVLLFLQEKDQKYIFAAVDQKPSVISLQKLIAREVANEERGMFLISASSAGPEMYEIHTNSKEERNNWMRRIQQAVESCPEEEGGRTSESDEEKRKAEARVAKIQQCQEILTNQDQQICTYLEEKLRIYAELGELSGFEDVHLEPHLLIKPDPGEPPQAASLLTAALKEAESLQVAVKASQMSNVSQSSKDGRGESVLMDTLSSQDAPGSPTASLVTEGREGRGCWDVDPGIQGVGTDLAVSDAGEKVEYRSFPGSSQSEIIQAIQNLTRLLYSLQAALTIQDSHIEIHKLVLQQQESLSLGSCLLRGSPFQDHEKSRDVDRQREELANMHQLQHQLQQEQRHWLRRCDQQQRAQAAKESWLQEQERECQSQEELLQRSRGELDHQLQEYQHSLERLREGQRLVERERASMRVQQSLLGHWKHSRQRSLPAAFPLSSKEVMELNRSESLCHENSFFINEALVQMSLNTFNKPNLSGIHQDATSPPDMSNSDLVRTSENQVDLKMDVSQPSDVNHELWTATGSCHQIPPLYESSKDSCKNDLDASHTASPTPHDSYSHHPQLQTFITEAELSLQTMSRQDGETGDGVEENIVYL
ncbi:rho guanine nucleotide exchange factor 28 isoform 4 [Daubentonia madagascariensis]|uniref:Rho guanine nucleotide exchange factor 28 n=1 Tax=Daubentonia madagascariensis TaxID=31869 RepID=A0ABD2EKI9_DAUMA